MPLFEKKKWHKVGLDDNNNNNRDEPTIHTQFTDCMANTVTDSHILFIFGTLQMYLLDMGVY